jgi:diguanylate cyclase (GGDEF)-like protein/PAS domain S-box-containing protein
MGHTITFKIISGFLKKKQHDEIRELIRHMHDLLIITNAGKIQIINPSGEELLGYSEKELLGKPLQTLFKPDLIEQDLENPSDVLKDLNSKPLLYNLKGQQIICLAKNGKEVPIHFHIGSYPNSRQAICFGRRAQLQKPTRNRQQLDPLTGVPNRLQFNKKFSRTIENSIKSGSVVVLMYLDINHFKSINDQLGHIAGDKVLVNFARRLRHCIRGHGVKGKEDMIARLGGDEFVILLEMDREGYIEAVESMVKRIIEVMKERFTIDPSLQIPISVSIGISLFPDLAEDEDSLIKQADEAMYWAKEDRSKSNFHIFSPEMKIKFMERQQTITSLHSALGNNEFILHYQPQFELMTGMLTGVEALMRWNSPDGQVYPLKFIPLLEETGLIIPVGEWLLHSACAQNKIWQDQGYPPICLAINLSMRQFEQDDLIDLIRSVLEQTGLAPEYLDLEITESMAMKNVRMVMEKLMALRNIGVKISIDDFGTGFSSLTYLDEFPINTLKIDKKFVEKIESRHRIPKVIIEMAHAMDATVIAEGIEKKGQMQVLKNLGCDMGQGYLFSRPIPSHKITQLFANPKLKL